MKIINLKDIVWDDKAQFHLFNSPRWLRVISKTYGIEFSVILDEEEQQAFPFCLIDYEKYQSVKSVPFADYTLINYSKEFLNKTLNLLKEKYPERYIETTVINPQTVEIEKYRCTPSGTLIRVGIQQWKTNRNKNDSYERNITHALNQGITVRRSNSKDSLWGFYKLHEQLRIHKFKKLPQPLRFFSNIFDEFISKGHGFFLEAWNKDLLIASWVILAYGDTLYYKFGASDMASLKYRPNDLLFRSLMQMGAGNGFKTVDLGFSGASKSYEGLIRFKSKEGGQTLPIFHLEYFPETFANSVFRERGARLGELTRKALATGDVDTIRKVSNENYFRFA